MPPTPLDPEILRGLDDLADEGEDVLGEMAALFLVDARDSLADAMAAAITSDADELFRATHKLKSSSAYVGALRVSKVAKAIEQRARDKDLDDVPGLMRSLDRELERAFSALRALRPGLG
jgi:HPt (histidine-containing phosphotransfer) domain-containing protein